MICNITDTLIREVSRGGIYTLNDLDRVQMKRKQEGLRKGVM